MTNAELDAIFAATEGLFDKDSGEYKEASIINKIESKNRVEEIDPLNQALSEATHLEDNVRERYIYLAGLYLSDMQKNIFRNQFELNKNYSDVSIDEWNDFLSDRIVNTYVNKHKRTLLKAAAEDNLSDPYAKNKRDNLQLIKNIQEQEQSESNRNICIIRIPDIYEGTEDN